MPNAVITGLGKCVPKRILSNADLEKMVDTSDEWIVRRTGIKERRIVNQEKTSDLAAKAAQEAIEDSGLDKNRIDLIITATVRGDFHFPSCACLVQSKIGAINAAAVDINAGCTGFIYGLDMADAYINSGKYQRILLIGVETLSRLTDYSDRNTCVLFGDGAGAAIIEATEEKERGVLATKLYADGSQSDLLYCEEPEELLRMDGNKVFKLAIPAMLQASQAVLEKSGTVVADLDLLIPHQANNRIIFGVAERVGIPENKIFINIHKYGNTSSATIPIAMKEAQEKDQIKIGDLHLYTAFGAGFTWGAVLYKW